MTMNRIILTGILLLSAPLTGQCAETFIDFNDIPATPVGSAPSSGTIWNYASDHGNSSYPGITTSGWWNTKGYPGDSSIHNYVSYYLNGYNVTNMGFSTYGYLEIDESNYVKGKSLKITTTGGITSLDNNVTKTTYGLPLKSKEGYLDYLAQGRNPIGSAGKVGHPYMYFGNNSSSVPSKAFPEAAGATRMSLYIYMPAGLTNGTGGSGNRPLGTCDIGPYNNIGGHWYHSIYNQGGGWTHVVLDSHPQHNNAWSTAALYPYPSKSLRAMGSDYFSTMYRWYFTLKPYEGVGQPVYNTWIDEVEFINDSEPQNDETISSPAITFYPSSKNFEIGFSDKYRDLAHSYSTYEMRYSLSPITNANWNSATPVSVQADSRFGITANSTGIFKKWWPYYQAVWAPFKLQSADESKLNPGTTIYFAIKDVSQNPSNLSVVNPAYNKGRPYSTYPSDYDYAGDAAALPYIKRIDYYIGGKLTPTSTIPAPDLIKMRMN